MISIFEDLKKFGLLKNDDEWADVMIVYGREECSVIIPKVTKILCKDDEIVAEFMKDGEFHYSTFELGKVIDVFELEVTD